MFLLFLCVEKNSLYNTPFTEAALLLMNSYKSYFNFIESLFRQKISVAGWYDSTAKKSNGISKPLLELPIPLYARNNQTRVVLFDSGCPFYIYLC